jgi:hypothetical protein
MIQAGIRSTESRREWEIFNRLGLASRLGLEQQVWSSTSLFAIPAPDDVTPYSDGCGEGWTNELWVVREQLVVMRSLVASLG